MWSLVVRIYQTKERARDAATKLKEAGFSDEAILELTPGSAQSVASAILAGHMMGHRAGFYADRVKNGRSLVAVNPPFGQGQLATEILDGCGPVDQDLPVPEDTAEVRWGSAAAPLSAALGLPVLSRNQPAPLSDALGMPTRSRSEYYLTSGLASQDPAPLSRVLGLRLLIRNPTPLSSRLGLPVLLRWAKSSSFGMRLLSDDPAPLSSALGMPTLSRNPTPLSSALGLQVLTKQQ
jgi:hypothetical protein